MDGLIVYLIAVADRLGTATGVCSILCGIAVAIGLFVSLVAADDQKASKSALNVSKWFAPYLVISLFLYCAIPSSKALAAVWLLPKVIGNEDVQGTLEALPRASRKLLESYIEDVIDGEKETVQKESK